MDEFWEQHPSTVPATQSTPAVSSDPNLQYQPPSEPIYSQASGTLELNDPFSGIGSEPVSHGYDSGAVLGESAQDGEFGQFEEDEMTRKIREEETRIAERLREKSEKQYQEKLERKEAGRKQFDAFTNKKAEQKSARAEQNLKNQQKIRQLNKEVNAEAGWRKVTMNVNLKQGEYKGKKDVGRMRESILHKREDEASSK